MCLCIDLKYHKRKNNRAIPLVAEQTIFVHKMVEKDDNNHYYTPYNYMPINFDDEYGMFFYKTTRFSYYNDGCSSTIYINKGIHSFTDIEEAESNNKYFSCLCGADVRIYNAVIPKGSKFFIGRNGDIVSSNLVVFKNKTKYNKNKKYFGDVPIEFSAYLKKFGIEVDSK